MPNLDFLALAILSFHVNFSLSSKDIFFSCKPRPGCDFTQCGPVPSDSLDTNGFASGHGEKEAYHITCHPDVTETSLNDVIREINYDVMTERMRKMKEEIMQELEVKFLTRINKKLKKMQNNMEYVIKLLQGPVTGTKPTEKPSISAPDTITEPFSVPSTYKPLSLTDEPVTTTGSTVPMPEEITSEVHKPIISTTKTVTIGPEPADKPIDEHTYLPSNYSSVIPSTFEVTTKPVVENKTTTAEALSVKPLSNKQITGRPTTPTSVERETLAEQYFTPEKSTEAVKKETLENTSLTITSEPLSTTVIVTETTAKPFDGNINTTKATEREVAQTKSATGTDTKQVTKTPRKTKKELTARVTDIPLTAETIRSRKAFKKGRCPIIFKRKCFLPVVNEKVSKPKAQRKCEKMGGKLANIYSERHMDMVMEYIRKHYMYNTNIVSLHLGMSFRIKDMTVFLQDGTTVATFTKWVTGYPRSIYRCHTSIGLEVHKNPQDSWQFMANIDGGIYQNYLCEF